MSGSRTVLLAGFLATATLAACDVVRPIADDGAGSTRCAACHGYPPPPGILSDATIHPNDTNCHACHPLTVDASGNLIAGGGHENGKLDVLSPHAAGFDDPSVHGPAAIAALSSCKTCHGADLASCTTCHSKSDFADWKSNCTFCHGTRTSGYGGGANPVRAAPPRGVRGETSTSDVHVGAHARHLEGGSWANPVPCVSCHIVPTDALGHFDGGPADVTFGGIANIGLVNGSAFTNGSCTTYCHGATLQGGTVPTPSWTGAALACDACHGYPPATGEHIPHVNDTGLACGACHPTATAMSVHVNGQPDVAYLNGVPTTPGWICSNCH